MLKFKLGAALGFAVGWLVGTGRAAAFWDQFQGSAGRKAGPSASSRPLDRTA